MWNKFFRMYGISNVFDKPADGGDTNNPNLNADGTPVKPAGGGDNSKGADDKGKTFELNINGDKRNVTLEEMQALATKSAGADKRFQDAAEMRKEAEKGLRISSLMETLQSDKASESDTKELAVLLGLDPGEFMQYLNEDNSSVDNKQTPAKPPQKLSKDELAAGLKELGIDPVEVTGILGFSKQRHIESARQEIRKISDEAVDKDEIFGKMMIGDKEADRKEVIQNLVAEDVLRKIQDGVPFGADMVAASVQKIRAHLVKFGIPSKLEQYPITLGLVPSEGLPPEVQADEPIKRISAIEDGAEDNFVNRFLQRTVQKMRSARKTNS